MYAFGFADRSSITESNADRLKLAFADWDPVDRKKKKIAAEEKIADEKAKALVPNLHTDDHDDARKDPANGGGGRESSAASSGAAFLEGASKSEDAEEDGDSSTEEWDSVLQWEPSAFARVEEVALVLVYGPRTIFISVPIHVDHDATRLLHK